MELAFLFLKLLIFTFAVLALNSNLKTCFVFLLLRKTYFQLLSLLFDSFHLFFFFFPMGCYVKDLATGRTLLKVMGPIKDNLCPLDLCSSKLVPPDGTLSKGKAFLSSKTTLEACHNRLGHPNFQVVSSLSSKKNVLKFLVLRIKIMFVLLVKWAKVRNFGLAPLPDALLTPFFCVYCNFSGDAPISSISGININ